jgi:hypothetical protein
LERHARRSTTSRAVALLLVAIGGGPTPGAAQVADVEAAVTDAMTALTAGDLVRYLSHYSPNALVIVDHSATVELDAAGFAVRVVDLAWTPGPVDPQVFGGTAVTVIRLEGSLQEPGGATLGGPWRYAETRTRAGGVWRIVGVELSTLDPTIEAATEGVLTLPGGRPGGTGSGTSPGFRGNPDGASRSAGMAADQPAAAPLPAGVPAAPRFPDVITRDEAGNATIRAIRLDASLQLDGELDEPVYSQVPPLDHFIQSLPDEGEPATELTEAWIMYDNENVYVSARVHEEVPEDQWTANEMRRDAMGVSTNDNFGLVFDTYYDRRNGYFFYTNPLGAMVDVQVTNEGSPNFDWNPVWDVRTGRFEGGWTVEVRIPFESIR